MNKMFANVALGVIMIASPSFQFLQFDKNSKPLFIQELVENQLRFDQWLRKKIARSKNDKSLIAQVEPTQTDSKSDAELERELEHLDSLETDRLEVPSFNLPTEIPKDLKLEEAGMAPLPVPESFPVIFKAFSKGTLSSEVTSIVLEITHRMGERFNKGDLLIRLDDTVFEGLRRKGLGNLAKAQAELSAKEELYRERIASIYEVKTAQANVAVATSDLINAEHAIKACYIRAPYDGKVVNLMIEEFELIQEGKPLVEIVNDDYLIGQVLVPAKLLPYLVIDKPLRVKVLETNTIEAGRILRIDAVIDPASSLIKVDIIVDNRAQRLRSGMIGRVTFQDDDRQYTPKEPYLSQ